MQALNPTLGSLPTEGLTEPQALALQHAQSASLPAWKRTNITGLNLDELQPVFGTAEVTAPTVEGLWVGDWKAARAEQSALVARYRGTAVSDSLTKFVAYNAALAQDGVVVHVARNVIVTEPIRVRYTLPASGAITLPRTLIVAEANSQVMVIEEFVSADGAGTALTVPVAEIFANDGANVSFMSLQTLGAQAYSLGAQTAVLGRDAQLFWLAGAAGGLVQHTAMDVQLRGNGSSVNWLGFTFATKTQQLLWAPQVHHIGLSTTAQIEWKTAVADTGYAVFDGMIKIDKTAQGTNSDLRDNVLHLSPAARSDSIPGLEIDANEVKAGHGSTSGQVDEEQVFYLRTRGMSRQAAVSAIVLGFFASIVERVPLDDVRDRVLELIEAKL